MVKVIQKSGGMLKVLVLSKRQQIFDGMPNLKRMDLSLASRGSKVVEHLPHLSKVWDSVTRDTVTRDSVTRELVTNNLVIVENSLLIQSIDILLLSNHSIDILSKVYVFDIIL